MRTVRTFLMATLAFAAVATTTAGQAQVTTADLSRLETSASEIERLAGSLKQTDATLAADVQKSLADLRDEIAYLRVTLRREGAVTREEYASLRDRLESLRVRAQGSKPAEPSPGVPPNEGGTVAVGTQFDARLQTSMSSATATLEQRFEATTVLDYAADGVVLVPAGSVVRGFVSSVERAGRLSRRGSLTLSFDEIRIGNRSYPLRASVTEALDASITEDAARIGTGAVVGAILGGLFGGGRGALIGVLVGGGGTIAATSGTDVDLPAGTILRIRLDQPLQLAAR
jgi:hypothetical protein